MSVRPVSSWGMASLAALVMSGFVSHAQLAGGQGRGRVIEFSEPRSRVTTTNLNQFDTRKEGVRQLENELDRSFRGFSPNGSLDGAMAPPVYRPVPSAAAVYQNRRAQEYLDRRKNWAFAPPEDWALGISANLLFDNDNRSNESATDPGKSPGTADPLLEILLRPGPASNSGPGSGDDASSASRPSRQEDNFGDSDLPSGIRESAQSLRKHLDDTGGSSLSGLAPVRSDLSGWFGSGFGSGGEKTLSPSEVKAHKDYLDQYRQLIGVTPPTTSLAPLNDLVTPPEPSRQPIRANGLEGFASTVREESFGGTPAAIQAFMNPTAVPDLNQKVLKQWDPLYTPPKIEPPKSSPITVPMSTAPRRKF